MPSYGQYFVANHILYFMTEMSYYHNENPRSDVDSIMIYYKG